MFTQIDRAFACQPPKFQSRIYYGDVTVTVNYMGGMKNHVTFSREGKVSSYDVELGPWYSPALAMEDLLGFREAGREDAVAMCNYLGI